MRSFETRFQVQAEELRREKEKQALRAVSCVKVFAVPVLLSTTIAYEELGPTWNMFTIFQTYIYIYIPSHALHPQPVRQAAAKLYDLKTYADAQFSLPGCGGGRMAGLSQQG